MRAIRWLSICVVAGCVSSADPQQVGSEQGLGECSPTKGLAYFETQIWPKYLDPTDQAQSCVRSGCHDATSQAGGLGLDVTASAASNYERVQPLLDCAAPSASLLFTKPLDSADHGGGAVFTATAPQASTFLGWFQ